jgi:predicted PurR-regulated permease PerM
VAKNSRFTLLVSMCIIVAGLYFAREVLIPIALAILVTFLLTPPVAWLEKLKVPRVVATLFIVLLGMGLVGGVGYVVGKQLAATVNELHNYQVQLRNKIQSIGREGGIIRKVEGDLKSMAADGNGSADGQIAHSGVPAAPHSFTGTFAPAPNQTPIQPTPETPLPVREYPQPQTPFAMVRDYASSVFGPLATGALVLVFVVFMLLSREDLRDRVLRLLGHGRMNVTTQALDEASNRISNYLGALTIVNGCYGLSTALGLWLIGKFLGHGQPFPNVLVWGLMVGVCRFIPYIGIFIGAGVPILLGFALFPGHSVLLATFILFASLELVVSQFIEPMWYGSSTGMSALAVLVAAVFWTWLWGTIGLLLSTPLTVILVVMGKYVPQLKFLDILLREEGVLSPPLRFYQRLIALDQEEAADLARDYLSEHRSLQAVYDDVLIPALSSAMYDSQHQRLNPEQLEFVRQSVRDVVDELAEQWQAMDVQPGGEAPKAPSLLSSAASTLTAAASTVATVASNVASAVTGGGKNGSDEIDNARIDKTDANGVRNFPRLPTGCMVNVLCLPSRDEVDEIVAIMLSQLLQARGYCVSTPTAAMLASEMVEMVEQKKIDVICVSAMPPAAVAHARYLCKRIHARYPDAAMAVGLWTLKGDLVKARDRISCTESVRIVTNLHDAVEQLEQLAQPAIVQNSSRARAEIREADAEAHRAALTS